MGFDKLVEQKIREAMAAGEFERLAGEGRPVDLSAYFSAPEELRAGQAVLKNAGVVPEEMQLRGEINQLRSELVACADEERRGHLRKSLAALTLKRDLLVERNRKGK
jgi:hypothetical protein